MRDGDELMSNVVVNANLRRATRRQWLAHCSCIVAWAAGTLPLSTRAAGQPAQPVILVVGDSLSAEYGLPRGSGWVALLEQRLAREKIAAHVINASVSGDTTSGGRSRLPALLAEHKPTHVILELGGNDALRGLPLTMTQDNLSAMARAAKAAGARVIVVGMQVPPNYGRKYAEDFAALFATVARNEGAALVPFLLKGVADVADSESMFQPDRIHPRQEAHPIMLGNVWPVLLPLLRAGAGPK
jgi:acyl-CoA thioesterase-1